MNIAQDSGPALRKPLRLWPGVAAVSLWVLLKVGVPIVKPEAQALAMLAGVVSALIVIVWWAFFSRAAKLERWGGILLMVIAMAATWLVLDKSIKGGMMGFMFPVTSIPFLTAAFVAWAALTQRLSTGVRRATMVATVVLACGAWTLLRTNGISGDAAVDLAWRWSKTAEEKLVAQPSELPLAPTPAAIPAPAKATETVPVALKTVEPTPTLPAAVPTPTKNAAYWPGFRGSGRDSVVSGIKINTNWAASPPVQLWRRPVGPGWSSFAVNGDLIYTQEQRGEDEIVACYNATTGKPVWVHRDAARFWESNAGAGPRATPTLHQGHVYALGATGILNALDAATGAVLWSRNSATDTGATLPGWGFAGSPLIVGDKVVVATSGRLAAYDIASGSPRWTAQTGGGGYSSPQLAVIDGVQQIVFMSGFGATSVEPAGGRVLWKYEWKSDSRILQPGVTANGDLLITSGDGMSGIGMRRIAVAHGAAGWTPEERWVSTGLKPNFNDFVVNDGLIYGFDGSILACVDAQDGKRKWKGGRYGYGQMVLLRDQGVLLVLSEEGELALVKAAPDQFTELARVPALEGKTWNHPVITGDRLLVRNGTEMAAYKLALESH